MKTTYKTATKTVAGFCSAVTATLALATPSLASTFRYTTPTTTTLYNEGETTVAGLTFDGTFENTVLNPFSGLEQTFSGFYRVQAGQMGEAMSIEAVQQSPTDRTGYLEAGLSSIQYLVAPEPVSSVADGFTVVAGMTSFDFRLDPAAISEAPTLLSQGWRAEKVPEPSSLLAMLGVLSLAIAQKRQKRHA